MANIPENTQYQPGSGSTDSISKRFNSLSSLNFGGSFSPSPTRFSPSEYAQLQGAASKGSLSFRPGQPIGGPAESKVSDLPSGYSSFRTQNADALSEGYVNPNETKLRQMPDATMGQYVTDPTQPGGIVQSNREYVTPSIRNTITSGYLSDMYEVDHIIPLWAGGADAQGNLQILSVKQHEQKKKAEAVPLTLLYANKIDAEEAKRLAMTWQNKDLSILPELGADAKGTYDVDVAQKIYDQWKKDERSVKFGAKDVIEAIPEQGTVKGDNPIESFARGAISGVTMGWIPFRQKEDADIADQIAGVAGQVAGTILSFLPFTRVANIAFRTLGAAGRFAGLGSKAAVTAPKLTNPAILKATGEGFKWSKIPSTVTNPSALKAALKSQAAKDFYKQGAIWSAYGQLSKFEEDTLENRVWRMATDLTLGGLAGATPSRGLSPLLFSKESATLGSAGVALGLMSGEDPQEALVNGLVLMGLHQMGSIAPTKINPKQIADQTYKASEFYASNWLEKLSGVKIKPTSNKPGETQYNPEQLEEAYKKAKQNILQLGQAQGRTARQVEEWLGDTNVAYSVLVRANMPASQRAELALDDLYSTFNKIKDRTVAGDKFTIPQPAGAAALSGGERLFTKVTQPSVPKPGDEVVTGQYRLTGFGSDEISEEAAQRFINARKEGSASDYIIMVPREELAPVWREISGSYTPKQIKAMEKSPIKNPQNSVQAFYVKKGQNGLEVDELGWVPRRFRIEDSKYAFNKDSIVQDGAAPALNPALNKDTVAEFARKEGLPFILGRVDKAGVGQVSRKPFVLLNVTDDSLALTRQIADDVKAGKNANPVATETSPASIITGQQKNVVNEKLKWAADELKSSGVRPDSMVMRVGAKTENIVAAERAGVVLSEFGDALRNAKTPAELASALERSLGLKIGEPVAKRILEKKNDVRVKTVLGLFDQAYKSNAMTAPARAAYEGFILPFVTSKNFRDSDMAKTFAEMKLITGPRQKFPETFEEAIGDASLTSPKTTGGISGPKTDSVPIGSPNFTKKFSNPDQQRMDFAGEATQAPVRGPVARNNASTGQVQKRLGERELLSKNKDTSASKDVFDELQDMPISQADQGLSYASRRTTPGEIASRELAVADDLQRNMAQVIETFEPPKNMGGSSSNREGIINMLKAEIDAVDLPTYHSRINPKRYDQIKQEQREIAYRNAANWVEESFYPPRAEAAFKTGYNVSPGEDAVDSAMVSLIRADTRQRLGLKTDAKDILESVPDKDALTKAAELLGMESRLSLLTRPQGPRGSSPKFLDKTSEREAIARDTKSFLDDIEERASKAEPGSYEAEYLRVFDAAAKSAFGPNYKNYGNLQRLLTDISPEGRLMFRGTTKRGETSSVRGLFAEKNAQGGALSQPLAAVQKAAQGDRKGMRAAFQTRRTEQSAPEDRSSVSNQWLAETSLKEAGFSIETPKQRGDTNEKDMNQMFMRLFPGLVEQTSSSSVKPATAGAADAVATVLALVREHNQAFGRGTKNRVSIRANKLAQIVNDSQQRAGNAKRAGKIQASKEADTAAVTEKWTNEAAKLEQSTENLRQMIDEGVSGKYGETLKTELDSAERALAAIRRLLEKRGE